MEKFWKFRNSADGRSAELKLYGAISDTRWFEDDVSPKAFADDLDKLGDVQEITVRINSGGGDVFAAQTIGNLLAEHKATTVARIDGLCASAATLIACKCDKTVAAPNSYYMIHPIHIFCGSANARELEEHLGVLRGLRENAINLYAQKTGRDKSEVAEWMDNTSWFPAKEARERGFVDEILEGAKSVVMENRDGVLFVNSVNTCIAVSDVPQFAQEKLFVYNAARQLEPPVAGMITETEEEMDIKTVAELCEQFPELTNELQKTAEERGVSLERQRIRDIEDMALPGSEALTAQAKFEKPMSADEYARAMLKNAREQGTSYLQLAHEESDESGVNAVGSAETPESRSGRGDAHTQGRTDAKNYLAFKEGRKFS